MNAKFPAAFALALAIVFLSGCLLQAKPAEPPGSNPNADLDTQQGSGIGAAGDSNWCSPSNTRLGAPNGMQYDINIVGVREFKGKQMCYATGKVEVSGKGQMDYDMYLSRDNKENWIIWKDSAGNVLMEQKLGSTN